MIKSEDVPSLIAGFILFIAGLMIILYAIFGTMPTEATWETIFIWVLVLIIGIFLTIVGVVLLDSLRKRK